jgi:hypothetical protein
MYVKIEPSGCCERKGLVQIRLCMYLDDKDYGYESHHVQVPDFTGVEYKGEMKDGSPVDSVDYQKRIDSLPKIWQNNSFHNHFIQVNPDTTETEIMDIAEAFLHEAYIKWASDTKLDLVNDALPFVKPSIVTPNLKTACEAKVQSVKAITTEWKI